MKKDYQFKSLQIAKNGEEKKQAQKDPNALTVFETGDTRTIDFCLLDGTRQCFLYSHMLTAWLGKDSNTKENNNRVIKIVFATHLITINGFCLDDIYNHLTTLTLINLKAHDQRYLNAISENSPFITNIKIMWKKEENDL
ncbi:hypothetical protein [Flavivirga jejuensis]|uniref:Uncharacterized protein n=1 Tax=Flavivirga jejuensis TaxID=870487 RepID=A0ABT8WR22_9FLAO|nr:hypothetical protein [Flavivirga jejuensis]MDO5975600.1 hypothetical protein [Flavivirga jejuensis]